MEFQEVVPRLKKLLIENELTIATAESLTAGLVSSYLASVSGSSGYLLGGVAAYTIDIKHEILGVDKQMAIECNAYSAQVAREMAEGVCELYQSNLGISTTGYAEPSFENGIDVPQAYIAVSFNGTVKTVQIISKPSSRNEARDYIAKEALMFLLQELEAYLNK